MIPARYESTRLPGKLLLDLGGKPLILHTVERSSGAACAERVLVATDDPRIADVVERAGFDAVMTSRDHQTGSDRIVEAVRDLSDDAIIINVQGDEPLISPATIDSAFDALVSDPAASMSTTCESILSVHDVLSPDVVKVVVDRDSNALYFSRSPIPFPRDAAKRHGGIAEALAAEPELLENFRKHTGLYAYRCAELRRFALLPASRLESCEMLEQLRALESGFRIKVAEVTEGSVGVDTAGDLERVREIFRKGSA